MSAKLRIALPHTSFILNVLLENWILFILIGLWLKIKSNDNIKMN